MCLCVCASLVIVNAKRHVSHSRINHQLFVYEIMKKYRARKKRLSSFFSSTGLQEGPQSAYTEVVATCKHFTAYDLNNDAPDGINCMTFDAQVNLRVRARVCACVRVHVHVRVRVRVRVRMCVACVFFFECGHDICC